MEIEYRSILEKLQKRLQPEPTQGPPFPVLSEDEWDQLATWALARCEMPRAPQLLSDDERTHWMSRRALVLEILDERPKPKHPEAEPTHA